MEQLPACPVETTLMLIGDKWKVLILRDLIDGTKRFGELKRSIGSVSQKVLTAQLRDMEEKGLVSRKVYAEVPPRVEYTLTETGYSLKPILRAMECWAKSIRQRMHKYILCLACRKTSFSNRYTDLFVRTSRKSLRDSHSQIRKEWTMPAHVRHCP